MVGHQARRVSDRRRERAAAGLAILLLVASVVAATTFPSGDHVNSLSAILGVAAVIAGVMVAGERDGLAISASFLVYVLAGVFLGPRSAAVAAITSELAAALRLHTRMRAVVFVNLPANVAPAVAGALLSQAVLPSDHRAGFYATAAAVALMTITLGFVIFAALGKVFFPRVNQFDVGTFLAYLPNLALNIALVVAGTGIKVELGSAGIAFALSAVFTFSYMAHLLDRSRHRAAQYVSLSWGVLAGLLRSLDIRDQRAARHAAAVARFARDMAKALGMSEQEQELAHTAGLLHDIGHFALSDRVHTRGPTLTDEDWEAIYRHPELGADMLKDLGMYGPVAEIVLSHHERPDGRGYPRGLVDAEIPAIAKIIAVAEVYDTLTAKDTYRTRMSSFEALRELRREAGTQFDPHYVEVLASLLTGEGVEYRHADEADFDTELDMERRIKEARAG
jgi:putative nucleotidyltransferase with HDIG domain